MRALKGLRDGFMHGGWATRLHSVVEAVAALAAAGALIVLGVRASVRLEQRWDTFAYHIPFAAKRAGLGVPYEISDSHREWYEGFPPLADFVQGVLWRVTGSVNATGVANYLALLAFLVFCRRQLKAPVAIVTAIALTAPLVVIHAATSYTDLFGNAFLAIGVAAVVAMYFDDRFLDMPLLGWALAGFAAAAWSKFQMVPFVAAGIVALLVAFARRARDPRAHSRIGLTLAAAVIGAAPYIGNIYRHHNPFWPFKVPAVALPYAVALDPGEQRPPPMRDAPQVKLFAHSLLEIDHPTSYEHRERWIIDQGNAWIAFRMGGFWNVAVVTAAALLAVLGVVTDRRRGLALCGSMAALILFVAILPQSHELRYYQFLPLTFAALIAMFLARARASRPLLALSALLVILGEFSYMTWVNRVHYRIARVGYAEAAAIWQIPPFWAQMKPGTTYCAVGFTPAAIILTGPTMREFTIVERTNQYRCPPGSTLLRRR